MNDRSNDHRPKRRANSSEAQTERKSTPRARILRNRDADVGYGKPPSSHQFKPGRSGNPKGRPKGSKNHETILNELLSRKIPIREEGRVRKVTIEEGIYHRFVERSLKGDHKAATFLFGRQAALRSANPLIEETLGKDDKTVLDEFRNQILTSKLSKEDGS